jgi:hypothetical protein
MKVKKKYLILAVLFLILNLITATQYAITDVDYHYPITPPVTPPYDPDVRYIGSDNSSDGIRVLRVIESNSTNTALTLRLGNIPPNMKKTYSAAFGIVNEKAHPIKITHINVLSNNNSYLKIWLHGNREVNADLATNDTTTVLMWDNNKTVNASNTTAWILAAGDSNPETMCYNVSDRLKSTIDTPWDQKAQVRYSTNNSNALNGVSDFVWIQITVDIPGDIDALDIHMGTIWIHIEDYVSV